MQRLTQEALRKRLLQPSLWFAPRQHLWLQCAPSSTEAAASASSLWRVQWGLTAQGMDRLGDVTKVTSLIDSHPSRRSVMLQGQDLLHVHWEGYNWTEADELYHTVWESVEGTENIAVPVTGEIVHIIDSSKTVVDEDVVWVEMKCREHDLIQAAVQWTNDEALYERLIQTLAPSKFSDQTA